ncbi:MAG TPA: type IV secretion system DNA-binding domain-containing protein [Abditibacteriaceae bacterium]|jgi:hypothetical protein
MLIRFIENLLITIFNSMVRGWRTRSEKLPLPEPPVVPPPGHVVIGHVIAAHDDADDAVAQALLQNGIVALTPQARKRHLYVLGATGTGKTNMLLHLIESDINNKRAFCVIDLRGDLVDRVLLRLADAVPVDELGKRLLLIDLRHNEDVVGFNPLSGAGDSYNRAMQLLEIIKLQSDSWGVQLEETLRNSLIALAEAGWSLLEIEPLLTNAGFRTQVLDQVDDTHVKNFFERYDQLSEANKLAWSMAVLNKVTPLLAIPQLRLMFGQKDSVSFRSLWDNEPGMVVLVSLAIDRLHQAAHLTGGLLISALQNAVMSRVDQPEEDRVPVQLFCDEFEMMASDRFQEIVAEGRRFGVGLCLSHQNLTQLSPTLRNVLRNNVHSQVYFQTGATDAAELAKEITGSGSKEDVRKALISQDVGEAFLVRRGNPSIRMKTLHCPDPAVIASDLEAIKRISRETYARPRSEVEQELAERHQQIKALATNPAIANAVAASSKTSTKAAPPPTQPAYVIQHVKTATFKPGKSSPAAPIPVKNDEDTDGS